MEITKKRVENQNKRIKNKRIDGTTQKEKEQVRLVDQELLSISLTRFLTSSKKQRLTKRGY